jgi:N-acetylglucosamine kinase-like BadF-type ATPase
MSDPAGLLDDDKRLYVGIDLGGSATRAALVDAGGRVLASGRAASGLVGAGAAGRRHLARALDAALAPIVARAGGVPCSVFAGTRGLSIPGRRETLTLELHARFSAAEVRVSNDALIALWGALAGGEGVAVLAGTGSIALARAADGREGRAGGWGPLLGDEGSGYWLGREALGVYLRTVERRDSAGQLSSLVEAAVEGRSVTETIAWLHTGNQQVSRVAALAPLVAGAAEAGDPAALDILRRAARALADLARGAGRQVWGPSPPEHPRVACCGGVWAAGPPLADAFALSLRVWAPGASIIPPRLSPVGGAVLLAMGADRRPLPPDIADTLARGFAPREL